MSRPLPQITAALLDAAKKAGASAADAIALQGTSIAIDVRAGKLEQAERSEGIDVGLRVFIGQRQATVGASDASPSTLARMAERAVAMAKEAPEDPHAGLADPEQLARETDMRSLELWDDSPEPEAADLEADARAAEEAALEIAGVTQVQSASAAYGARDVHMSATNGFDAGYRRSDRNISCIAISGEGTSMQRDWDADTRIFQHELRSAQDIGRLAGERAIAMQGARRPKTGTYPILFDERISSSLIGHLLNAINGAAIARGASFLRNDLGKQVLPAQLSLYEEPHRKRISGSRLYDGEGLPTQNRALVQDGLLQSWTLDLATGRKLGLPSTGNAGRGTSSPPMPAAGNLRLTAGTQSRTELLKEMGTGLLVTGFIGSTINPNTGDYSRGVSGFWVENGEIAYPVHEITAASNLREMFLRMIPANDARTHLTRVIPSILIDGMTVAGA